MNYSLPVTKNSIRHLVPRRLFSGCPFNLDSSSGLLPPTILSPTTLCIPICCSRFSPGIGRGIAALPSRDGFRSWLRHTGAGSPMHLGRIEFNIVLFTDWSFASGCSPPILSFTQLPSATDRPVLLSDRDFHPAIGAYFQAHLPRHFVPGYYQPVPPGQKPSPIEAPLNYLSAYEANPWVLYAICGRE